jgi:hypothetical protein
MNVTFNYTGPAGAFCGSHVSNRVRDNNTGCKARLQLPLNGFFDVSKSHACVQLTPGSRGLDASATLPVANITQSVVRARAEAGSKLGQRKTAVTTANCLVDRQGLFVVVQYDGPALVTDDASNPSLDSRVFSTEAVALDKAQSRLFTYTFNMDYGSLAADKNAMTEFKTALQKAFLTGLASIWTDGPRLTDATGALRLAHATVKNVRSGSVIAEVLFVPPTGTSALHLEQLARFVPADLIASSEGLRSTLLLATTAPGPARQGRQRGSGPKLAPAAIAGIAAGAVVALACLSVLIFAVVARGKATACVPPRKAAAAAAAVSASGASNAVKVPSKASAATTASVPMLAKLVSSKQALFRKFSSTAADSPASNDVGGSLRQSAQLARGK